MKDPYIRYKGNLYMVSHFKDPIFCRISVEDSYNYLSRVHVNTVSLTRVVKYSHG